MNFHEILRVIFPKSAHKLQCCILVNGILAAVANSFSTVGKSWAPFGL